MACVAWNTLPEPVSPLAVCPPNVGKIKTARSGSSPNSARLIDKGAGPTSNRALLAAARFIYRGRCFVRKSIIVAAALACVVTTSAAQQDAPVVVLVRVFATPGRADELQAVYLKRLEYFRKAEPDATFRLHRSTKDTNSFLWYEVYPSQAAYENHVKVVNENFKK